MEKDWKNSVISWNGKSPVCGKSFIFTEADSKAIYVKGALSFLSGDLGHRLIAAQTLHREWPFTMQLNSGSPTMIQGIVDAAFLENDKWILIDYKTDRDTRKEVFVPRHEKQMNWYRSAVGEADGLSCAGDVAVCTAHRSCL